MDPSIFKNSQPQYILPEGAEPGTGKRLEHYLGQIGWGVGGGFAVGSVRGFFPELFNPETRQLVRGSPSGSLSTFSFRSSNPH